MIIIVFRTKIVVNIIVATTSRSLASFHWCSGERRLGLSFCCIALVHLPRGSRNHIRTNSIGSNPPIARFMWPSWGPSGADRTQVGPMLAPWTLLPGTCFLFGDIGLLLIGHLGTYCSVISIKQQQFSRKFGIWKCRLQNGGQFVQASIC